MPQPHSLRQCLRERGLDPSGGIRTFMQERSLDSVRALCGLQKEDSMRRQKTVTAGFDPSTLQLKDGAEEGRFVFSHYYVPLRLPGSPAGGDPVEELGAQLKSNFGVLFLDRTRVVPKGSVLGEELLSLSMAPGEEVVVEQKTFSKREVSFEEQNEVEEQIALEFDATLSTTLEEGLEFQQNHSSKTDTGLSGSIGATIKGVSLNLAPSTSTSVSDSDTSTRRRSVKDTTSASSKVASRYRTAHKTIMRISSEDRFESASKRTLRNPNRYTPIDLRYFKIYQLLQLSRERFGARLVWSPAIAQPGAAVMQRAQRAYDMVLQRAVDAVQLPTPPTVPPPPPERQPRVEASETWRTTGGWPGGNREDKDLAIQIPTDYTWDGNFDFVKSSLSFSGTGNGAPHERPNIRVNDVWPWVDGTNLKVSVHAGWSGSGTANIQVRAGFIPKPNATETNYQTQVAQYTQQLNAYSGTVANLHAQARAAARDDADAAYARVLTTTDPLSECLAQLVNVWFPFEQRSESWKIDRWRSLFDWDNAAISVYPGWWTSKKDADPMRDPTRPGTEFVNASWARVHLPIRPGQEKVATMLALQLEKAQGTDIAGVDFATLIKDLSDYRSRVFGDPQELSLNGDQEEPAASTKFIVLGTWNEVLPTNGTHLEVVQANTGAEDDISSDQLSGQKGMDNAEVANLHADADIKEKLTGAVTNPNQLDVSVLVGDRNGQNSNG